jgi:hypothetical protein
MRFQVKPHSGILSVFLPERRPSALAIGHLAAASLLLLLTLAGRFHPRLVARETLRVGWRR